MKRTVLAACLCLVVAILFGCADSSVANPNAVRERDMQRKEVAKNMPGNDIPADPADE